MCMMPYLAAATCQRLTACIRQLARSSPTETGEVMSARKAVVVGGGPVGALTAIVLAEQGWKVQVFEQASLPAVLPTQQDQRAYRLSLMSRALHVLKLANVNMDPLIATQGQLVEAARYNSDGTKSMSASMPMTKNPQMVRGYRDEIALHIIREAKRLHPQAILFHFNSRIQKVDLDKHTVHACTAESASAQVTYDLLVGADGAGSVVRLALQQTMPAHYMRRYTHKQVYSMAQVTPSNPAQIPQHTVIQLHVVKGGVVLWDGRGSNDCRVGLTVSQEDADAIRQGNTDECVTMLCTSGPSMPDYARKAAIELAQSRPQFYPMPHWTHLSQLHGPKTVLLGDAAHTMSPVLGQGLNAGLEDVAVFGQCLEQHQGNVDTALLAYNRARLPDVQAIMTINEVASSQDSGLASQDQDAAHKMWLFGHKVLFILHMAVYTMLHKAAPSIFDGPRLKGLISGTLPYRSFLSTIYQDGICFASFLVSVTALALWVF